jgi:hypothetical protein
MLYLGGKPFDLEAKRTGVPLACSRSAAGPQIAGKRCDDGLGV